MTTPEVWLPYPAAELAPLPDSLRYRFWRGEDTYPGDPAHCVFYTVPYLKGAAVAVRPLAEMTGVRVVQTLTAGVEHMLPEVPRLPAGALLCNAGELHNTSTAELALALTLAALRGVDRAARDQLTGTWASAMHPSLADRRVLILGYGGIGAAIEERLLPFEVAEVVRVAGRARTAPRGPVHASSELPRLLPEAEVVLVATPLTDATRGLLGARELALLPDGALVVNVARGAVIDTEALLAEVSGGRLRAALDVTDPEPLPPDHPLWRAPGVLITPHVGGPSTAFEPRAKRLLRAQLTRFAAGEELRHVVATGGSER
ncbi:2-hydroxyacid dehydrogenase [Streptomyces sp. DSM 44915]|uniref:2-hydroxyacid dehydrogenase n=1 Tax=Streptomyces chisholmiae TaxID=3075540 RepID=A0ABU2JWN3_9ACTN|nr:2-hydroxyacid dehydrogenase [Streptomyces sp. DSM 44915]MDT0269411.1 2-hydroxyacid dehydrogenase [Streptomyces sp. DSM 44915]